VVVSVEDGISITDGDKIVVYELGPTVCAGYPPERDD